MRRPVTRTPAWHEDGYEYRLRRNDVLHYVLERRKVSFCGVEVDWEESSECQVLDSIESLGRIETTAFANALAAASLAALHDPRGQASLRVASLGEVQKSFV